MSISKNIYYISKYLKLRLVEKRFQNKHDDTTDYNKYFLTAAYSNYDKDFIQGGYLMKLIYDIYIKEQISILKNHIVPLHDKYLLDTGCRNGIFYNF